jgi:hypothetical protein
MAYAALAEIEDHLEQGLSKDYITVEAHAALTEARARASSANRRLRDSLRSHSMAEQEARRRARRRV